MAQAPDNRSTLWNESAPEVKMLQELDVEDLMAIVRLIRAAYVKVALRKEIANFKKKYGTKETL